MPFLFIITSSNFSDPEMLGFLNKLLFIPRYNVHFGSLPENSTNGGVRYTIHRILFSNMTPRLYGQKCKFFATSIVSQFPEEA